jgi:DNA-directed RNA polymerase specialized sigma24 family protein
MNFEPSDHDTGSLVEPPARQRPAPPSDGCLLARFVSDRDEVAFEALVTRHGPMVLRLCRRLTADPHDAEDAFRATFLVLACRAGSVRDVGRLDDWLFRVAFRVALRARSEAHRRPDHKATEAGARSR